MNNQTTETRGNQNETMKSSSLITHSTEDLKKEELIGVLAGLIKNYANKKRRNI